MAPTARGREISVSGSESTLDRLTAVMAGHVPPVGTRVAHPSGWTFEVTHADERRVHKLRLHPPVPPADDED